MGNKYADSKSAYIQQQMKNGMSNKAARKSWDKSVEKAHFNIPNDEFNNFNFKGYRGNVDRSFESPMQDWAETSEDF